jgi:hypothetical protein
MPGQASSKLCYLVIGKVRSKSIHEQSLERDTVRSSNMQKALEQASADDHSTVKDDICRPGYETHKYHFEGLAGD